MLYLAPDNPRPSGGVRSIYRQVDVLRQLGADARVVHERPGFRAAWFENHTPVLAARDAAVGPTDVLVVPEIYGPGLGTLPRDPRKLVLNQGAYLTFDALPWPGAGAGEPYRGLAGLEGLLTVSEDSERLLGFAFPELPRLRVRNVVDPLVFRPATGPRRPGPVRLACTSGRRPEDRVRLQHLLRAHGTADAFDLRVLEGLSEEAMAEALRDSDVFVSLGDREGFGMPPAEAMACGCYVIGFDGRGGREFFDPTYCRPVSDGDLLGLAEAVDDVVGSWSECGEDLREAGRRASRAVLTRYSSDGLRTDLAAVLDFLGSS
ncbi:hypothetical protein ASG49_14610 [Marmoricola sp. Leaf446]|uniref:glycosyltransferase n=1 Tax=Marmoricola sp. Leaf446 TaxID=1736379 RepID=UPI0006FE731D|nr:glycosyltransferase [Marmoricola sp. Leaf446]KQT90939.1 hypothetical protein ASG49_14610 [Marmoricola sp. Leaf446]